MEMEPSEHGTPAGDAQSGPDFGRTDDFQNVVEVESKLTENLLRFGGSEDDNVVAALALWIKQVCRSYPQQVIKFTVEVLLSQLATVPRPGALIALLPVLLEFASTEETLLTTEILNALLDLASCNSSLSVPVIAAMNEIAIPAHMSDEVQNCLLNALDAVTEAEFPAFFRLLLRSAGVLNRSGLGLRDVRLRVRVQP
jgi:hypothetical protein